VKLPKFEYFPNPLENGCIVERHDTCPCCSQDRAFMYEGPIYTAEQDIRRVCPWCIADGSASAKWSASFNDVYDVPDSVPHRVIETISLRTPGYPTWQGNKWMFSATDALTFLGEVVGAVLMQLGEAEKIAACREALIDWNFPNDFDLSGVVVGGQPAIYLFQDKQTSKFSAYADMT